MEPCLIDNKICSKQHKRCIECKLDSSKKVVNMIETHDEKIRKIQEDNIRRQLPARCRNCRFLQYIDLRQKKLYCPYMINDCIIK